MIQIYWKVDFIRIVCQELRDRILGSMDIWFIIMKVKNMNYWQEFNMMVREIK